MKFLTRILLPLLMIGAYLLADFILDALFTNIQVGESVRVFSFFYPLFLLFFPLLLLLHGLICKTNMYISFNLKQIACVILGVFLFLTFFFCYKSTSFIVAIKSIVKLAVIAGLFLMYLKMLNWSRDVHPEQMNVKLRLGLVVLSTIIILSYSLIFLFSNIGLIDYNLSILYTGAVVSYAWLVMITIVRYNWVKILILLLAVVNIILLNNLFVYLYCH